MSNVSSTQPSAAGAPPVVAPPGPIRPPAPKVDFAALASKALEGVNGAPAPDTASSGGSEATHASPEGAGEGASAAAPLDAKAVAAAVVAGRRHQEKLRRAAQQDRQRAEQATREAQSYRQAAEQQRAILDQLRAGGDPSAALQALGVSPEALARAAIDAGSPAAQLRAVQEQLAAEKRAREQFQAELRQRDQRAVQARAEENFYAASQDEKKYPALSKLPRAVILTLGDDLANKASKQGQRFTFSDLLESLEVAFRGESKTVPQASGVQAATETQSTGAGSTKPPTRTITSADTTSSASTPVDLKSLPAAARYREIEKRALELAKKK